MSRNNLTQLSKIRLYCLFLKTLASKITRFWKARPLQLTIIYNRPKSWRLLEWMELILAIRQQINRKRSMRMEMGYIRTFWPLQRCRRTNLMACKKGQPTKIETKKERVRWIYWNDKIRGAVAPMRIRRKIRWICNFLRLWRARA